MSDAPPNARLLQLLDPILARVAELDPSAPEDDAAASALVGALESAFPRDGEALRAIGAEIRTGIEAGWLCDRGEPDARFSRLAKPGDATRGMSIDVVSLRGEALRHTHPQGEVTIAYPAGKEDADARFDGHAAGWVFMRPGSTHTPTVTGGRMDLIYFLPDGAVKWHR